MPKPTAIVLVIAVALMALLWLYTQADPVPNAADGPMTADSSDPDPNAEVAALGAQDTPETAGPITPGLEDLLEPSPRTRSRSPSATLERHESLLAEARDEEWAQRIESTIRG